MDLSSWRAKILEEMASKHEEDLQLEIGEVIRQVSLLTSWNLTSDQHLRSKCLWCNGQDKQPDVGYHQQERFQNGLLTIGCVGQPNVGKSSLINALMGKKVNSLDIPNFLTKVSF